MPREVGGEMNIEHISKALNRYIDEQIDKGIRDRLPLDATSVIDKLILDLKKQQSAIKILSGALEEFRLYHDHQPGLNHTRAMGDSYGWCDRCHTKVSWGPGEAEIALAKAQELLK